MYFIMLNIDVKETKSDLFSIIH